MKRFKMIWTIVLLTVVSTLLAGCSILSVSDEELTGNLVRHSIDIDFYGEVNQEALDFFEMTEEEAIADNERNLIDSATIMLFIYSINENSTISKHADEFVPIYDKLYKSMDIEVSDGVKIEDEKYLVSVKFKPILLSATIDPEILPIYDELIEEYGNLDEISGEDLVAADQELLSSLETELETFSNNIQYGNEEVVDIEVYVDEEGAWSAKEEDYYDLTDKLIDYDLE